MQKGNGGPYAGQTGPPHQRQTGGAGSRRLGRLAKTNSSGEPRDMLGAGTPAEGKPMSEKNLEARVELLEAALATAFRTIEQERYVTRALQTVVFTLINSLTPDDPAEANEWFDAMRFVAMQNADLRADLAADRGIAERGLDPEMLAAMEDERQAVTDMIESIYAMLQNPEGGLTRD